MAIQSSLVTARTSGGVKKLELQKAKNVGKAFNLDPKAKTYYSNMLKNYANLKTYFTKVGEEFNACATKSIKGDKLQATLKKISKNCTQQGTYCSKRAIDLKNCFRYAEMEKQLNYLAEQLEALSKNQAK